MATRNLTQHFVRARAAAQRNREAYGAPSHSAVLVPNQKDGFTSLGQDHSGGSNIGGAAAGGWDTRHLTTGMAPIYVDMVDDVHNEIQTIQDNLKELEKLHSKRLMVQFDANEQEQEREIDILTHEITRHFNSAGATLKRIAGQGSDRDGADAQVRRNIQRSLAAKLHEKSKQFRQAQKEYLANMKRLRDGANLDVLTGNAPGGATSLSAKEVDMGFTDNQVQELAEAEDMVEERDKEIQQIARSIEELATIFKDLATLIVDQGTILDRVDYNMEQTVERTKQGMEQLVKAEKYQKSARPMKCILVLMLLIIILTIWLVVKHT